MDLRNGREILFEPMLYQPEKVVKVSTYTDNHTVLITQSGHELVMNSASDKTFTLPSVAAANVGLEYTFTNINTGRLTIDAADSDTIDDSNAGGTIYSDDNTISSITIRLVSSTHWQIVAANGTWTTT